MAYEDAAKNAMLDELGTLAVWVGLLDEVDAEISGGDPAYARKGITYAAASGGSMAANGTLPTFDIPAGTTVSKVILMSAETAGTKYAEVDVDNEAYTNQGAYELLSGTLDLNA